jgi:hypothetical protein
MYMRLARTVHVQIEIQDDKISEALLREEKPEYKIVHAAEINARGRSDFKQARTVTERNQHVVKVEQRYRVARIRKTRMTPPWLNAKTIHKMDQQFYKYLIGGRSISVIAVSKGDRMHE